MKSPKPLMTQFYKYIVTLIMEHVNIFIIDSRTLMIIRHIQSATGIKWE